MPDTVPSWKPLTISWRLKATVSTSACFTGGAGCAFNIRLYACTPTTGGTFASTSLSIRLSDPPLVTIPVTGFTAGTTAAVFEWSFPGSTPSLAAGNYAVAIEVPGMTTTGTTTNVGFSNIGFHVMR